MHRQIESYTADGSLTWLKRPPQVLEYDFVFDCTGAKLSEHPLLDCAVRNEILMRDKFGLGFETDALGESGKCSGAFILGPQLRANFWECTAVPELRDQAKKLAMHLTR